VDNFAAKQLLTNGEEQLESGEIALLPDPSTPGMIVASHNVARITNSRDRLLPEIIKLFKQQGHNCKVGTWLTGKPKRSAAELLSYSRAKVLLKAPVVTDHQQLQHLLHLQSTYQLTQKEKEALSRHF
jgi:hypothetical protein